MENVLEGQHGIYAKVLTDSVTSRDERLVTYEISYPRIILAELNTHRMLPKNSSSSRAIPFEKMMKHLIGRPTRFGGANPGMQDTGQEHTALVKGERHRKSNYDADWPTDEDWYAYSYKPEDAWEKAKEKAIFWSKTFYDAGYAKQIYNRLTEPFQMMKTVISGTEWANFFWLRNHEAADPTLQELAKVMHKSYKQSVPTLLKPGQWHLPYVDVITSEDGTQYFYIDESDIGTTNYLSLEDAIKVSCARCAAVSFRNTDYTLEKSKEVYDRLVGSDRKHASAFEHCATPIEACRTYSWGQDDFNYPARPSTWEKGISHVDRNGDFWSGPYKGFIQYRKLIPGENYTGSF